MFEIGFSELVMVGLVSLLVIGLNAYPQRHDWLDSGSVKPAL